MHVLCNELKFVAESPFDEIEISHQKDVKERKKREIIDSAFSAESCSWMVRENGWCSWKLIVNPQNLICLYFLPCYTWLKGVELLDGNCFWFIDRFRFVLSPRPTPATLYLLKRCKWDETEELSKLDQIEICPKAMDLTQTIARRIGSEGGAALIIDYGINGIVSDSLQVVASVF